MLLIHTGKVTVSTAAVQIVAARAGRTELRLDSAGTNGNVPAYFGPANTVTMANGYPANGLAFGALAEAKLVMEGAVWAIAGGPMTVYFLEIYDDGT